MIKSKTLRKASVAFFNAIISDQVNALADWIEKKLKKDKNKTEDPEKDKDSSLK